MVRTHGGCWVAAVLAVACGGTEPASEQRTETDGKCDPVCAGDEECTDGECLDATGKPTEVEGMPSGPTPMSPSGIGGDTSTPDTEEPGSPTPAPTDGEEDPSAPGTELPSGPTPTPTPIDIPTLPPLEGAAGKVDLLFVVDNSLSMAQSQNIFVDSVPHLISRLADPFCLTDDGVNQPSVGGECPEGTTREFAPIADLHVGVVTTSIGAFGAAFPCENEDDGDRDNAHLMGSLSRVQAAVPGGPTFLGWCAAGSDAQCAATEESDPNVVMETFRNQAAALGESGCGWEATLETFYRFLVEPTPWTQVVRQNCPFAADMNQLCVGPETDANGVQLIDQVVLEQRKAFLRPDSLLAIVALTNENDCSFKASGQSWRLSETRSPVAGLDASQATANKAYKGSTACLTDPNGECCVSCGTTALPAGCPSTDRDGQTVSAGCEEPRYPTTQELAGSGSTEASDDAANLRCFHQKQRFGVDYLYPVQRYVNALTLPELCPTADDLAPDAVTVSDGTPICTEEELVQNPLFVDFTYPERVALDPSAQPIPARPAEFVLFMGILGVPWQSLTSDPSATSLVYDADVDWVRVLGNATPGAIDDPLNAPPTDPHMLEQVEARAGTDPAVNGGEWNILDKDELQYACVFPLPVPIDCPSLEEVMPGTPNCDCTYYGDPAYANPVCNGQQQVFGKAFPSIRPLQVIRDLGAQGIATSICAKQTDSTNAADWGYRPAFDRLIAGMRPHLVEP